MKVSHKGRDRLSSILGDKDMDQHSEICNGDRLLSEIQDMIMLNRNKIVSLKTYEYLIDV